MNRIPQLGLLIAAIFFASACGKKSNDSQVQVVDYASLEINKGYTIFTDKEQAKEWYSSYRSTLSIALGGDAGDVIDFNDSRYATLNEMLAKIWPAFQSQYPEKVDKVPAPIILLLKNDVPNAFATYDRIKQIDPNVFFVLSGIIENNFGNKEAIFGVIAHELAHHVLRHGVPGISATVDKYYVARDDEPLGLLQSNDNAVKDVVKNWIEAAKLVGPFSIPQLRGSPMPNFGYPLLYTVAKSLASSHKDRDGCSKMTDATNKALSVIVGGLNIATQELIISDAKELMKLDAARQEYNNNLLDCLAGDKDSVLQAIAKLFNVTEAKALEDNHLTQDEIDLMKNEGETATSLIAFSERMSDKKVELNTKIDLSKIRNYSIEEQADDVAVEVLIKVGESAEPLIKFLKSAIPASQLPKCLAEIDAGIVPGYGVLSDNHHSSCYRIFHANKIGKYLTVKENVKAIIGN